MGELIRRIDWTQLTHAYGTATNVPNMLAQMLSPDAAEQHAGWDTFYGAVNHQGDFYDSTVAVVPVLIEALQSDASNRAAILNYFKSRWDDAPNYGGDPLLPEPPGGIDIPTPMLSDGAELPVMDGAHADDEEDFDIERYRRMDLCAWQTGRAILAGIPVYRRLLKDAEPAVCAAAAELLLIWPQQRAAGKRVLIHTIDLLTDPMDRAKMILEMGVYGSARDLPALKRWIDPSQPDLVRAAAALAYAWIINPNPPPTAVATALHDTTEPTAAGFAKLPWHTGLYDRGPWKLPQNMSRILLRLLESSDDDQRWRAMRAMEIGRSNARLADAEVIDAAARHLNDPYHRVRASAAAAIGQRGALAYDLNPAIAPALVVTLSDENVDACGQAANTLATIGYKLSPPQRAAAITAIQTAGKRFATSKQTVFFGSSGRQINAVLKTAGDEIRRITPPTFIQLLSVFERSSISQSSIPASDCERLIAEEYDKDPARCINEAIAALREDNWTACRGAISWLQRLGPAAQAAIAPLEKLAGESKNSLLQTTAKRTAEFIRRSMTVRLLQLPPRVSDVQAGLRDADPAVRAAAACAVFENDSPATHSDLVPLLHDAAFATFAVSGKITVEGQTHYWRQEWRSPRAWAVRALLNSNKNVTGFEVLTAMVEEALRPATQYAGINPQPQRFTIEQWKHAIRLTRRPVEAELRLRAARRQCSNAKRSRESDPESLVLYPAAAELAEVIRVLSGKLLPF